MIYFCCENLNSRKNDCCFAGFFVSESSCCWAKLFVADTVYFLMNDC